jgi:thioredoxin-like negative regulator of GroEL
MLNPLVKLAIVTAGIWVCFQGYRQWQTGLPPQQMAEFAMWREDWNGALKHLALLRQEKPHDQLIIAQMAECYDKLGDTRTAMAMYRSISRFLDDREDANRKRYHRERYRQMISQTQAQR